MSENITNTAEGGNTTPQEERTFTQEQLNAIVGERLQKERQKSEADIVQREQELAKREFMLSAKSTLTEKGYPVELLDNLNCADSESLEKILDTIDSSIESIYRKKYGNPPASLVASLKFNGTGRTPMMMNAPAADPMREAMGLPPK